MTTTNLGMTLPTVGADSDTWGNALNTDLGLIDSFAGSLMAQAEVSIASAATTDIGAAACTAVAISGTTAITSLGSGSNKIRFCRFIGTSLVLTYNATSLITPTGGDIQTAAGDGCIAMSDGSGNWRIVSYTPVGGVITSRASYTGVGGGTLLTSVSVPAGKWRITQINYYNGSAANAYQLVADNSGMSGTPPQSNYVFACSGGFGYCTSVYDITNTETTTVELYGAWPSALGSGIAMLRAERII